VNDELCEEADAGMFVTLLFAILDTTSGELEYCNAGHLPPFLLGTGDTLTTLGAARAPALALAPGLAFPTARHRLAPGDALFFFTDGVTEALSPARDFYTPQRLENVLPRRRCAARRKNHARRDERRPHVLRRARTG